jgi:Cu(I)/Ag(I) efflux system membrane protein CusA/SilA
MFHLLYFGDVMKRIATPMVGGVVTSTMMELIAYPAIFCIWRSRRFRILPADESIPTKVI